MKNKSKQKYKLKPKFANGTQTLNPNVDPSSIYKTNREQSTGAMQFNNNQQALVDRSNTQQQLGNNLNTAKQDYANVSDSTKGARSTAAGIASAFGPVGMAVGAGIGISGGISDSLNQSNYEKQLSGGKKDQVTSGVANVIDPTTNLIQGLGLDGGGFNGSDLVSGLTAGLINLKGSKEDIATTKAVEAKKRQDYANNQVSKYGAIDNTIQAKQIKNGNSGIHIKPENKGKFTAYKQRTGKTTEEALHSKDPHVRQMANFAKNAKKWKHESGSKDVVLDKLIKGHSKSYKMIEKNESPEIEKQELQKFKQLKKLEKEESREIETEGREPIFSPKKKDGTRDLLYYNPSAPTHKEGGVPAKVVPKSSYKMKSGTNKLVIPEGSAIVTAKDNQNKKAIVAYKKGDYKTVNKIINKMPSDSSKKKANGDEYLTDLEGNKLTDQSNPNNKELEDSIFNYNKSNVQFKGTPTETPLTKNTKSVNSSKFSNTANSLVGMAPTIYNLGKGIFDKPTKTTRRMYNPEQLKYKDMSGANRKEAEEEFRVNQNNIRNATGGSGSSYLANQALAQSQRYKTKEAINTNEANRMFDIDNTNVGTRNQAQMTNLGLSNQYDEQDLMNRAKKSEYLGKGLEGLSQGLQMNQLNKNRAKSDNIRLNLTNTENYTIDKDGNVKPKAKKGLKNIKYKMKQ